MTPTLLEIAVAILLLWVAWRLALLLTPWVLKRIRGRRTAPSQPPNKTDRSNTTALLQNQKDKNL
jgi:beta-lactamase regulating signal transducer with metallopeptidase domain